jgi:HME family heavy-metal exporter
VTPPVETALNGATGVSAGASELGHHLGMVFVEFDYGTDIFTAPPDCEREPHHGEQLPQGITLVLAISSVTMGQIMPGSVGR